MRQIICYDRIVIKANQVMPAVVAEVIRKAPLTDEKVAFAWRLAVGPAVAQGHQRCGSTPTARCTSPRKRRRGSTASAQSIGLIRSRLAHYLGEDAVKESLILT